MGNDALFLEKMVFHRPVGKRFLVCLLYVKMVLFQIVTWLDFTMRLSKR